MGAKKFQATAAAAPYFVLLTLEEAERSVQGWRETNPSTVNLWWSMDRAVKRLLADFTGQQDLHQKINDKLALTVSKSRSGRTLLTMRLPSGRRLYYRDARLVHDTATGRDEIVYSGVDPNSKRWGEVRTYGGKLAENATQAVARDIIVEAALRIDARRLGDLTLSVHDELVFEADEADAAQMSTEIELEINKRPSWAQDLPIASEGGVKLRYGK
jgi:DNA polymerase